MKLWLHRSFICQTFAMLRNVQQRKLRLSPFEQHGVPFTLVVAESDILPVNVPVARLQFSDQRAFRYLSAPQKPVWTDIVGECGKEQTVTPELAEYGAELTQVFPQECVRLSFRHGACRIPFPRLQPMSISYIRVMFFRMPALKILRASHRPLKWWQPVDSRLPVRSLMASVPCGHGTDRQKRTEDSHEYTHHLGRGLKLPMGITETIPSSFTLRLLKSNSSSYELLKLSSTTTMKLCASSPSAV